MSSGLSLYIFFNSVSVKRSDGHVEFFQINCFCKIQSNKTGFGDDKWPYFDI